MALPAPWTGTFINQLLRFCIMLVIYVAYITTSRHAFRFFLIRIENGNSAGDPPTTPKSRRAFAGILGGISPRPKRKTESDGNLENIRFE